MSDASPQEQLDSFLARYTPEIAAQVVEALGRVRAQLPGAVEMVYDNYNGLAIAFGATERASEAIVSISVMPRWINLFFLADATLPDSERLLQGKGNLVRHIRLREPADIDAPAVRELIAHALARSPTPFDAASPRRMVIKSISGKQRPAVPPTSRP